MANAGQAEDPIIQALVDHQVRPTRTRVLLLSLLRDDENHLDAEEIANLLRSQGHKFGIATLYQNLNLLVENNLLLRFTGANGIARFDANLKPHHHLICSHCGRIIDMELIPGNLLISNLRPIRPEAAHDLSQWEFEGGRVEVQALCTRCNHAIQAP